MNLQDAYKLMQENSGIEVGDKVRVLRKAKDDEMGWVLAWVPEMDKYIGEVYKVKLISKGHGISLGAWDFPFFVLEIVEKKKDQRGQQFKNAMGTAAGQHDHLLQNIPVEVYSSALEIYEESVKQVEKVVDK